MEAITRDSNCVYCRQTFSTFKPLDFDGGQDSCHHLQKIFLCCHNRLRLHSLISSDIFQQLYNWVSCALYVYCEEDNFPLCPTCYSETNKMYNLNVQLNEIENKMQDCVHFFTSKMPASFVNETEDGDGDPQKRVAQQNQLTPEISTQETAVILTENEPFSVQMETIKVETQKADDSLNSKDEENSSSKVPFPGRTTRSVTARRKLTGRNEKELELIIKKDSHKKRKEGSSKKGSTVPQVLTATNKTDGEHMKAALQNDMILQSIISHLGSRDVKSCRLVSPRWKEQSNKYFNKLHICSIFNLEGSKTLSLFQEDFPKTSDFQCSNFRFEGNFDANKLKIFLNNRGFIKELNLKNVTLKNAEGKPLKMYNVSNWNGLCLKTLEIEGSSSGATLFTVPFTCISKIESLVMFSGRIICNGRIAPKKMKADFVEYFAVGKILELGDFLDLNKYVDVVNLKELDVWGNSHTFRLDLRHCLRLEVLTVLHGEITGWHNQLALKRVELGHVVPMTLLAELPPSIQEFKFKPYKDRGEYHRYFTRPFSTSSGHLLQKRLAEVPHVPNFFRLTISDEFARNSRECNVSNLPSTIRSITTPILKEFFGEKTIQLDKLVFRDFQLTNERRVYAIRECMEKAIKRFSPKIVVLDDYISPSNNRNRRAPLSIPIYCGPWTPILYELIDRYMNMGGVFVMGRMRCCGVKEGETECKFCAGPVHNLITDNAKYILFENGVVKTIDKSEYLDHWLNG